MPYKSTGRLPREHASKIGHLEIIKSKLVQQILQTFEPEDAPEYRISLKFGEHPDYSYYKIEDIVPEDTKPLSSIYGVDGSLQTVVRNEQKQQELSFIKTAMLRLDPTELKKIDFENPHPFRLRDLMRDSAIYHATVIPLRNIMPMSMSLYDGVREIINLSLQDPTLDGYVYNALKWLVFEEWSSTPKPQTNEFDCPHCREVKAVIPYGTIQGSCSNCNKPVNLADYLAFHVEMDEDYAAGTVASSYMLIHETLLIFAAIKYFWETNQNALTESLFVKDGGLFIRAHYSKLVAPIRKFFQHAKKQKIPIHVIGQEKTGPFVDYLERISKDMEENTILIPKDSFIKKEILSKPNLKGPYGYTGNYGAKILVKLKTHQLVLTVPIGKYDPNPKLKDFIGLPRILKTIPSLLSYRYENALLPIELANAISSLSSYPSAKILEVFSSHQTKKKKKNTIFFSFVLLLNFV